MNGSTLVPPSVVDGARVLAYALIDDSVTYTGRSTLYVDGKLLRAVPRLVICQTFDNEEILLFFCDEQWNSLGVTSHASLKDAQKRAEAEYRGVSAKWAYPSASEEEIAQYLAQGISCSFCGKRPEQIEQMFQCPEACICNECVAALYKNLPKPPKKKKPKKKRKKHA